jgi:hypothetical protein
VTEHFYGTPYDMSYFLSAQEGLLTAEKPVAEQLRLWR